MNVDKAMMRKAAITATEIMDAWWAKPKKYNNTRGFKIQIFYITDSHTVKIPYQHKTDIDYLIIEIMQ